MNYGQILAQAYEALGYASNPPVEVSTRSKNWVNEGYRRLLRLAGLSDVRRVPYSFPTVANVKDYAISSSIEQVEAVMDYTQQTRLSFMTEDEYRIVDPGQIITGTPTHYMLMGLWPVFRQPAATGLWVASSSAGDTTQTATIQGIDSTGLTQPAVTATLNGVTRVALGSVTSYNAVLTFNISATAVGIVSLYDAAAAGNQLAAIPIGSVFTNYKVMRLWPTPTAVETINVDGQANVILLNASTDVPILPESFHDLLPEYARIREYERVKSPMYAAAFGDWTAQANKMRAAIQFPQDYRPISSYLSSGRKMGWNGIAAGGYYPADE